MSEEQITLDELGERTLEEHEYKTVRIGPREIELPSDWDVRRLNPTEGVTNRITDGSHHSPDQSEDGEYYYATVSNLSSNGIDYESCGRINKQEYDDMVAGDCKPRKGEVLFSKDGTVGITTVFDDDVDVVLLSSIAMIDPVSEYLHPDYLSQFLSSGFTDFQIQSLKSGTAIRRVVLIDVEKINVPIPTLEEQRKIASVLYTVDQAIQKTEELIHQVARTKRGTVQDLMTTGSREHDQHEIYRLGPIEVTKPVGWELRSFDEFAQTVKDGPHITPDYVDEGIPFVSSQNVNPFHAEFDYDQYEKYISRGTYKEINTGARPDKGDLIISRRATIGPTQLVRHDREFGFFVGVAVIKTDDSVHNPFLEQLLNWSIIQKLWDLKSPGSTMKTLNLGTIRSQKIPLPSIAEQKEITKVLRAFDHQIIKYEKQLESLQRIKRGLMQDLLSGEVRTHDRDIEVAEDVLQHG